MILVDLRKHSIKGTGGRSRKKHEDAMKGLYEEVDDSVQGERGMQRRFVLTDYPARDTALS